MKSAKLISVALLACALPIVFLQGCGGGGGGGNGGSSGTGTPTPTATTIAGANSLTIQLKDSSGAPVDGIVTVDTVIINEKTEVLKVLATSDGQATFSRVKPGTRTITVEVNGVVSTNTTAVTASGSKTVAFTISTAVTPAPTSTLPAPPF